MKEWKIIASIAGLTLILLVGVSFFLSRPTNQSVSKVDPQKLVLGATHVSGEEKALVTIVEFSDFQCPACREAAPVIEDLIRKYQGKIKFVYRHFPLTSIHKNAILVAVAAEAAAEQSKFWEYSDILFDQQDAWSQIWDPRELFLTYAKQVGVSDLAKFQTHIESQASRSRILSDMNLGNQIGVDATPTFFVNGEKTTAAGLQLAVEKVLSKP